MTETLSFPQNKPEAIYHAKIDVVKGITGVLSHRTPESMAGALAINPPQRVFLYVASDARGLKESGQHTREIVSLQDPGGIVHRFATTDLPYTSFAHAADIIARPIAAKEYDIAEGVIKVDGKTGEIYNIYQTAAADEPYSRRQQYESWENDVAAIYEKSGDNGFFQYMDAGDNEIIVDYTDGEKLHLVTRFDLSDFGYRDNPLHYARRICPDARISTDRPDPRWEELSTIS